MLFDLGDIASLSPRKIQRLGHVFATERAHLTTEAAGQIARQAGVRRVEPFHFSTRYAGEHERTQNEVMAAFAGQSPTHP